METNRERFTTTDGVELSFETRGDATSPPLLLLHGFTGSGDDWQHVFDVDALARDYRIVRPDARGHGRSAKPAEALTFHRLALDVVELLDRLGIATTRAIGMSLGAKTLLHVATATSDRIDAMVLVSATPRFPDATLEAVRGVGAPTDMDFDAVRLSTVRARTLLVSGDRDPLYPVELAVELLRGVPGASLYVVPGGGHVPVFAGEREAFVVRALQFLAASPE